MHLLLANYWNIDIYWEVEPCSGYKYLFSLILLPGGDLNDFFLRNTGLVVVRCRKITLPIVADLQMYCLQIIYVFLSTKVIINLRYKNNICVISNFILMNWVILITSYEAKSTIKLENYLVSWIKKYFSHIFTGTIWCFSG